MDVFQKCSDYQIHKEVRAAGLYPYYRSVSSPQDPVVTLDGQKVIMLGSNNYLGLTNHPAVKEASQAAIQRYGTGCAGSRLLNGTLDIHGELEERLAAFLNAEAVLTFSTGFQVNLGVLSCLLGRHDVAILDSMDHASIIDGVRLGFGKSVKYRHNDMAMSLCRYLTDFPKPSRTPSMIEAWSIESRIATSWRPRRQDKTPRLT